MHARWRFRLVGRDLRGTYVMADVHPLEIPATDLQALEQARKLMTESLVRVEAVPVGCPRNIIDTPGRALVFVAKFGERPRFFEARVKLSDLATGRTKRLSRSFSADTHLE